MPIFGGNRECSLSSEQKSPTIWQLPICLTEILSIFLPAIPQAQTSFFSVPEKSSIRFFLEDGRSNPSTIILQSQKSFLPFSGVIFVDTKINCPIKLTILANCITITPGTLTVKIEKTQQNYYGIYVHTLWKKDSKSVIDEIKKEFVNRVNNLW